MRIYPHHDKLMKMFEPHFHRGKVLADLLIKVEIIAGAPAIITTKAPTCGTFSTDVQHVLKSIKCGDELNINCGTGCIR